MTDVLDSRLEQFGSQAMPRQAGVTLRVGLLVDGPDVQAWQFEVLRELIDDGRIEIGPVWVLPRKQRAPRPGETPLARALWRICAAAEDTFSRKAFGGHWRRLGVRPEQPVPLSKLDVPITVCAPTDGEFNADVAIDFGAGEVPDHVLSNAHCGVLKLYHADRHDGHGGPAGFNEVLRLAPVTKATLRVRRGVGDSGAVVREGFYTTYYSSWSESRRRLLWKSRYLLIDVVKKLAMAPDAPIVAVRTITGVHGGRRAAVPSVTDTLASCVLVPWRIVKRSLARRFVRVEWRLLIGRGDVRGKSIGDFQQIKTPYGRFWADPFVIRRGDDVWVFFEDYYYATNLGAISCIRLTETGYDSFHEVLSLPYHLSYPFLLEHNDTLYMVPETYQNRTVEMWECVEFPGKWRKVSTLLEGVSAVDSTLVEHEGRWWMFHNQDRPDMHDHATELFVYHTDDPIHGTWVAHAANPIVVDPRTARMGGAFLRDESGGLIRCAQIGGPVYGVGMLFFEITKLTPEAYEETLIECVEPLWSARAVGVHTYNSIPEATVLDVNLRFSKSSRRER